MPATATYSSLLEELRNYLERGFTATSDPTVFDELPKLITLSERRCARELKILGFENVVTGAFTAGSAVVEKPDRWRATISINYGTGSGNNTRTPLFPRAREYCTTYWPDPTSSSASSPPEFYADYGYTHWLIVPTPASAYPFEVNYYEQPPFLDDSNQSNWLTDYAPELLLYGALLEASPFLKDDQRIGTWQGLFDRTAQAFTAEDIQRMTDRTTQRGRA